VKQLFGIIAKEYGMAIRRWGIWVAFGLIIAFYGSMVFFYEEPIRTWTLATQFSAVIQSAGSLNMFMVLICGIAAADRLQRDNRLGMSELINAAPVTRWTRILGKYIAIIAAGMTPFLFIDLFYAAFMVIGGAPVLQTVWYHFLGLVGVNLPAVAFVTAFSLAIPLILPLRVYQILFTGYWFWGNYLNPNFLPTLNGTLLTPSGVFVTEGLYKVTSPVKNAVLRYSATEAWLNLAVLAACIFLVMLSLERYLAWKSHTA